MMYWTLTALWGVVVLLFLVYVVVRVAGVAWFRSQDDFYRRRM